MAPYLDEKGITFPDDTTLETPLQEIKPYKLIGHW